MTTKKALYQIVAILLLMAGVFMIFVGGSTAFEAYTSQRWPVVSGEITKARVETRRATSGNRTYKPQIEYTFALEATGDDLFWGNRLNVDDMPSFESSAEAETWLQRYVKGDSAEIHYNPNRPDKNMLEPSFSASKLIYPVSGFMVFAGGLYLRAKGKRSEEKVDV